MRRARRGDAHNERIINGSSMSSAPRQLGSREEQQEYVQRCLVGISLQAPKVRFKSRPTCLWITWGSRNTWNRMLAAGSLEKLKTSRSKRKYALQKERQTVYKERQIKSERERERD